MISVSTMRAASTRLEMAARPSSANAGSEIKARQRTANSFFIVFSDLPGEDRIVPPQIHRCFYSTNPQKLWIPSEAIRCTVWSTSRSYWTASRRDFWVGIGDCGRCFCWGLETSPQSGGGTKRRTQMRGRIKKRGLVIARCAPSGAPFPRSAFVLGLLSRIWRLPSRLPTDDGRK